MKVSPIVKLIIFDLDGVLIDSRELHYEALNRALEEVDPRYVIPLDEHLTKYDGRPTTAKLNMLTAEKGLPKELHDTVWRLKQEKTFEVINDTFKFDDRLRMVLSGLKQRGYTLYCASNSIFKTILLMLLRKGLLEFFDYILSCEDVLHPKPAADIYIQCMRRENLDCREVMIVEDSQVGRRAALLSGAHLCPVENPSDVTLEKLMMRIEHVNMTQQLPPEPLAKENVNVVIPMAFSYSEYEKSGFLYRGPLLEVNGRPMVKMVVDNIKIPGHMTFIAMRNQYEQYHLQYMLDSLAPKSTHITTDGTPGQIFTVLLAQKQIKNDAPLFIVNCHQYIEWDAEHFYKQCLTTDADGVIATFKATHPRYSYVDLDDQGRICDVAETDVISDNATCGVYFWKRGSDFVNYAQRLIARNPEALTSIMAYKEAIEDGLNFEAYPVTACWQLKFPKDLENFYRRKIVNLETHQRRGSLAY
ncbi:HAD-like domain-containing protein [Gorgonomyces haynaldii]|nr:HAD-like domain-containing protein [Gorgonomyces haynaldii]